MTVRIVERVLGCVHDGGPRTCPARCPSVRAFKLGPEQEPPKLLCFDNLQPINSHCFSLLAFTNVSQATMDKRSSKSAVASGKKSQREKEVQRATHRSARLKNSKVSKVETIVLSSDSSDTEEIDADYAEFLKVYRSDDEYPRPSSPAEGSQVTVESKRKPSVSSDVKPSSER
ncbi:hypothetical protein L195_g006700 [Trifolium pratense]|uniref:Uncharacterized protein n=1 Tax=Trifolium pratense TaxID=57577 RepID=A0A2K3P4B5_TRIPR|nr:hypothetical protein L195_g006700 [Trifolium pratense]